MDAGVGKPFHTKYFHYFMTQTAHWVIMPFGAYLLCALCRPVLGLRMSAWGATDTPLFHAQESSGGGSGARTKDWSGVGFRFQKRIKILPGISINLGKRGASISMGPRGVRTTIGSRGVKHSFGIPGTGIRYETPYKKWGSSQQNALPHPPPAECPHVSFWERLRNMLGF